MSNRKTFPTALKIDLNNEKNFLEGCFFFKYRNENIIFHSDNETEFIKKLLDWSKYTKLMCFLKHPKEEIEINPLNYIAEFFDLKGFKYSVITTNKDFDKRFDTLYEFKNVDLQVKLNIIEVRLEKPYRLSFRNIDNVTPTIDFTKSYYSKDSIFNQPNNEKEIREITSPLNTKDIFDLKIENETFSLYKEILYYYERFYFEEKINIFRDQFSLKDLNFIRYVSKKKDII